MNTVTSPTIAPQVCINIGPKQRQRRLTSGIIGITAGVIIVAAALALGWSPIARLIALPFFIGGAFGFWQWREKTCVALVMKGVRNLDDGEVAVTDEIERKTLKAQADGVRNKALITGVALTVVAVLIPVL